MTPHRMHLAAFWLIACWGGVQDRVRGDETEQTLSVTNHESRSTVRYSVVLLRGTIEPGAAKLEIKNVSGAPARESGVGSLDGRPAEPTEDFVHFFLELRSTEYYS